MHSFTPKVILAASCFLLHLKSLYAAPATEVVKVIQVRQEEDGDDDGGRGITGPLRDDFDYTSNFQYRQNPTWYTIATFSSTQGTYLAYTTGNPKPPIPPFAASQGQGTAFNVDHVLELQVVASFVCNNNPNPTAIPEASWLSLRDVITNSVSSRPQRTPIAAAMGQFNNLGGIPNVPNGSKQTFFRGALNGYIPSSMQSKALVNANRRYLQDRRGVILMVIANVGSALGSAGSGGVRNSVFEAIASAWSGFALTTYDRTTQILVGGR